MAFADELERNNEKYVATFGDKVRARPSFAPSDLTSHRTSSLGHSDARSSSTSRPACRPPLVRGTADPPLLPLSPSPPLFPLAAAPRTHTQGSLPLPPAKHLAVLSCMDARFDPFAALGLNEGDAHHIRNAGGRFDPDAVRSLVISQSLLGTREVVVVHHTGCGMLTFSQADVRGRLLSEREGLSDEGRALARALETHEFGDLEESVREDVERVRRHPLVLEGTPVSGWVYEVETGRVRRVV